MSLALTAATAVGSPLSVPPSTSTLSPLEVIPAGFCGGVDAALEAEVSTGISSDVLASDVSDGGDVLPPSSPVETLSMLVAVVLADLIIASSNCRGVSRVGGGA